MEGLKHRHASHDQSTHGNWSDGPSELSDDELLDRIIDGTASNEDFAEYNRRFPADEPEPPSTPAAAPLRTPDSLTSEADAEYIVREIEGREWEHLDGREVNAPYLLDDQGNEYEFDRGLADIMAARGADGPPTLLDDDEWAVYLDDDRYTLMYRGGTPDALQSFAADEYQPGLGTSGSGYYFSEDRDVALQYATTGPFARPNMIEVLVPNSHRSIAIDDITDFQTDAAWSYRDGAGIYDVAEHSDPVNATFQEPGRLAAAAGYDRIQDWAVDRNTVILNRGGVLVRESSIPWPEPVQGTLPDSGTIEVDLPDPDPDWDDDESGEWA